MPDQLRREPLPLIRSYLGFIKESQHKGMLIPAGIELTKLLCIMPATFPMTGTATCMYVRWRSVCRPYNHIRRTVKGALVVKLVAVGWWMLDFASICRTLTMEKREPRELHSDVANKCAKRPNVRL